MAYVRPNQLVMKVVPTTMGGLGDVWGSIGTILGGGVNYLSGQQAAQAQANAAAAAAAAQQQQGGIDTTSLLLLAGLGLGGFFIYKKMKKKG